MMSVVSFCVAYILGMIREPVALNSMPDEPVMPLNGDEDWLGGAGVTTDGSLREATDGLQR
ncbi:hypothetical protein [Marisediminicola sp. LYQ134]|uniref:hypothetical protein n=1 Tax=Marisediminicola sp. LYQ134 TaxID=3391061 RepID=UPI003983927F